MACVRGHKEAILSWELIKEIFFTLGSIAGVLALARPVIEQKYQRDLERINYVKELINEQTIIDLDYQLYQARRVPDSTFNTLNHLFHLLDTNHEKVRFSGPIRKWVRALLLELEEQYRLLRELVQVDMWEPRTVANGQVYWYFNKEAFKENGQGVPTKYSEHLDSAGRLAKEMQHAYKKFLIAAELHLYEIPFAKWLLPKRYKKYGL